MLPAAKRNARPAVILVDHGSRADVCNRLLEEVAARFAARFGARYPIVEHAHMDFAAPTLAAAYAKCVRRGAAHILVCPFFLGPGKHSSQDIPRLAAAAAAKFPRTRFQITSPLGGDDLILDLVEKRVRETLAI